MEIRHSASESETFQVGVEIGSLLHPPRTVLLYGPLGAGKTLLTQGIAQGLGVDRTELVRSPSFTLINQYQGREGIIYHIDCYRLDNLRDIYSTGVEEILASPVIVIVEWAEKLLLEVDHPLHIRITPGPGTQARRLEIWPALNQPTTPDPQLAGDSRD